MSIIFVGDNLFLEQHLTKNLSLNNYSNYISTRSNICDFTDKNQTQDLFNTFDPKVIINYSGYGISRDKYNLLKYNQSVLNIIDCAAERGVKKIVHVADIGCYCHNVSDDEFLKEENLWVSNVYHNNCIYASIQKSIYDLYKQYKFNLSFLILEDIYGSMLQQSYDYSGLNVDKIKEVFESFDSALKNKEEYIKFFINDPYKYMLHVDDAARAIYLAVAEDTDCSPINIGSGFVYSMQQLIEHVRGCVGFKNKVICENTVEVKCKPLAINRAAMQLSWKPIVRLNDGLHQQIQSYQKVMG